MTGLSLEADALIEVAALVTDFELNQLGDGVDVVISPRPRRSSRWTTSCATMHTTSGLLEELAGARHAGRAGTGARLHPRVGARARKAPLGGNTVGTDRNFLARDMAELEAHLHYRIIDVSSIKELSRRWYPRAYFGSPKNGGHRALADIRESIDELRYYREAVFVAPPRPRQRHRAKGIAARHVVNHS